MIHSFISRRREILPRKKISIKPLIFLGFFVFSFLSSTYLTAQPASAITTAAEKAETDPMWSIKSIVYYRAIAHCLVNSPMSGTYGFPPLAYGGRIDTKDVSSGAWFIDNGVRMASVPIGMIFKADFDTLDAGGRIACHGTDGKKLISAALTHWGIDAETLLCNIGMVRVDNGGKQSVPDCLAGSTQLERPNNEGEDGWTKGAERLKNYIGQSVHGLSGGAEPELKPFEKYLLYKTVLANSCIPKITSAPSSTPTKSDNQYGYNDVKWVDVTKEKVSDMIVTGSYVGTWKKTDDVTSRPGVYAQYNEQRASCAATAKAMGDYADDYARWVFLHPDLAKSADTPVTDKADKGTSCGIEGIGWIVCPAMSFMGNILDGAFNGLADNFLATDIALFKTDSGTYDAWSTFRNFANVAFVIAFLIIIFSQLTSVGVSNYGVKKLLPRIIIAAILVNASYFICQIAVDLSNILGYSLKGVFDGIIDDNYGKDGLLGVAGPNDDASGNGGGVTVIVLSVIATVGLVSYFALGTLVPVLLGAVVAVLMIVLLLIARKAAIVLLIVLSPLAFVAFLLPNTESLFKKWRKAFMGLLLLFPIVAVVFGMSSLASEILLHTGGADANSKDEAAVILKIIALGVSALPFFVVPALLKSSMDGIGNVGSKLNNFASKTGSSFGKAGGKAFDNSRVGKHEQYRAAERAKRNALIQAGAFDKEYKPWDPRKIRNAANAVNRGINKRSGTFGNRIAAGGVQLAADSNKKDIGTAKTLLSSRVAAGETTAKDEMESALLANDDIRARAAADYMEEQGSSGVDDMRSAFSDVNGDKRVKSRTIQSLRQHLTNEHGLTLKNKASDILSWAGDNGGEENFDVSKYTGKAKTWAKSAGVLATQTGASLEAAVREGNIDPSLAAKMISDDRITERMDSRQIEALRAASKQDQVTYNAKMTTVPNKPEGYVAPAAPVVVQPSPSSVPVQQVPASSTGGAIDSPVSIPTSIFTAPTAQQTSEPTQTNTPISQMPTWTEAAQPPSGGTPAPAPSSGSTQQSPWAPPSSAEPSPQASPAPSPDSSNPFVVSSGGTVTGGSSTAAPNSARARIEAAMAEANEGSSGSSVFTVDSSNTVTKPGQPITRQAPPEAPSAPAQPPNSLPKTDGTGFQSPSSAPDPDQYRDGMNR